MNLSEFNKCVELHADNVYRFVLNNIRDTELSRDIVQESYTRLWEKGKEVAFEKAKSYLFTIAYHALVDHLRKAKREVPLTEAHHNDSEEAPPSFDLNEVLHHAAFKLPEIQRTVVLLRDYEGYSYEEIGNITGLNESQVKVYIYRARVFLKNYIRKPDLVI